MKKILFIGGSMNHPQARIRRNYAERQRVAEMLQIIYQLLMPNRYLLSPRTSYSKPLAFANLEIDKSTSAIMGVITSRAQEFLDHHMATDGFGTSFPAFAWRIVTIPARMENRKLTCVNLFEHIELPEIRSAYNIDNALLILMLYNIWVDYPNLHGNEMRLKKSHLTSS